MVMIIDVTETSVYTTAGNEYMIKMRGVNKETVYLDLTSEMLDNLQQQISIILRGDEG